MTDYEQKVLNNILKHFKKTGDLHYAFDPPSDPDECSKLCSTLNALESYGKILVLCSPSLTGDDYIEVEEFPPGCVPLPDLD